MLVKEYTISVVRGANSGDLIYSTVTIVNNNVYQKFANRVDLKRFPHTHPHTPPHPHKDNDVKADRYVNYLTVVIISQCICISKYHIVYHKYIEFLFLNHTSIRLE